MNGSPGAKCYSSERLIRFALGDQAGVMFFARVFPLAHAVLEDFLAVCGIGWQEWFGSPEYGIPFRNVQADYLRPMHPGDRVEARLRIDRLGSTSVTFAIDFHREGEVAAQVRLTCVFVSRPALRPIPVPGPLRERLIPYVG